MYQGKATYDSRSISYYQSQLGTWFHVIISKIFKFTVNLRIYKATEKERLLFYRANITDLFEAVKEFIQDSTGVPYDQITLIFEDQELSDSLTILDVGAYPCATVDVIFNDNLFNN